MTGVAPLKSWRRVWSVQTHCPSFVAWLARRKFSLEPEKRFAHNSPVASVGTMLQLLVPRHEGRDDRVEVVRRRFDAGIALDQFERVDQVCADVMGLGFGGFAVLNAGECSVDEAEGLSNCFGERRSAYCATRAERPEGV